jgi:hypothetical protein
MIDDLFEAMGEAVGEGLASGKSGCIKATIILIVLGVAGFLIWKYAL